MPPASAIMCLISPVRVKPRPETEGSGAPGLFGPVAVLPRGPHHLSPDEVAASQRARLLAAVTELVAQSGYGDTTITAIARRAGVSPNVFYEHFSGKEACYQAAYEVFVAAIVEAIVGAAAEGMGWERFVPSALGAYLSVLDAEPVATRAFLLEVNGAGAGSRANLRVALKGIADLLRQRHEQMRSHNPELGRLPDAVYLGLVHGIRSLVCECLEDHPGRHVRSLLGDLALWVSATVHGAAAAAAAEGAARAEG